MSMKERFVRKSRSYLAFFLLAAFAALLFFPRVASAAAKPTAKQLKVTTEDSNMTMIQQSYI